MYFDGCKYSMGGNKDVQKFKMKKSAPPSASQEIESSINGLATLLGMGSFVNSNYFYQTISMVF